MKTLSNHDLSLSAYNAEVLKAYRKIFKEAKALIASVERHELRCILERTGSAEPKLFAKVNELISPILYLSLEYAGLEQLSIYYGFEQFTGKCDYSDITAKFVRLLYKLTSVEHTMINIEDCVNTEYVIAECSALYDTVEGNNKHHTLTVIPYKRRAKRKLRKVA